jgi:hypothetical protein
MAGGDPFEGQGVGSPAEVDTEGVGAVVDGMEGGLHPVPEAFG